MKLQNKVKAMLGTTEIRTNSYCSEWATQTEQSLGNPNGRFH